MMKVICTLVSKYLYSFSGRLCKMLRTDRHENQRDICWKDCSKVSPRQAASEGENVSGDFYPP